MAARLRGVLFQRYGRRVDGRVAPPSTGSAPASWVENYSANITYTYIPWREAVVHRALVGVPLGGADDLAIARASKILAASLNYITLGDVNRFAKTASSANIYRPVRLPARSRLSVDSSTISE